MGVRMDGEERRNLDSPWGKPCAPIEGLQRFIWARDDDIKCSVLQQQVQNGRYLLHLLAILAGVHS